MSVASARAELLPEGTLTQVAAFTELAGTAVANAQARVELRNYAEEQAALRRVATLVAQAAAPEEVFAAVTEETGRMLAADFTDVTRHDGDGTATVPGASTRTDRPPAFAVGQRMSLAGRNVTTQVFQTGQPTRMDDYRDASGRSAKPLVTGASARPSGC